VRAAAAVDSAPGAASGASLTAFDLLATLVAVVRPDAGVLHANASFENLLGVPRRALMATALTDWLADPQPLRETLAAVSENRIATGRFEAVLRRPAGTQPPELLPVHVIVNQTDSPERVLVELIEIEQQTRQDREERAATQAEANKELVRNLAHEIKNPLGGIRGAAQLLEMELEGKRELIEYTQVVIAEADRLQALVDRLLAPHRRAHMVADVNIHEVCERVRSLLAAEFPRGIALRRDYDTSIPEFRGDREQLIQAVLNIARNACQALEKRIAAGDAMLILRTRIARQVTIGKTRWRLALELHIEDNGPGVPEAIRDRIFYPLVTGRDDGSGLGLTLAQTFVQQHQGTIECDSVPGRTVFTVLIPLP
jgi:two-component system, NtrC family, nitrogen regulation sensor histidine kinase GlnL